MKSKLMILLVVAMGLINLSLNAQDLDDVTFAVTHELCEKYDGVIYDHGRMENNTLVLEMVFMEDHKFPVTKRIISEFFNRFDDIELYSSWEYYPDKGFYACIYKFIGTNIYISVNVNTKIQNQLTIFSLKN